MSMGFEQTHRAIHRFESGCRRGKSRRVLNFLQERDGSTINSAALKKNLRSISTTPRLLPGRRSERANSKRVYHNDKERIIARVRANQRRNQEIEQLERLHELKEQGLITFKKLSVKDNHELLNNLEILGM